MKANARDPAGTCEVSIVMPCLNEAETLEQCIRDAQHGLLSALCDGEVLVADNGSTDGSLLIAEHTRRSGDIGLAFRF